MYDVADDGKSRWALIYYVFIFYTHEEGTSHVIASV